MKKNRTRKARRSANRPVRRVGNLPKQESKPAKIARDEEKAAGENFLDVLEGVDLPPFTKDDCVAILMECGHSRAVAELLAGICLDVADSLTEQTIAEMGR